MPFIVGRAAREYELYTRLKDFVTGVGTVGRAYFTGTGTGKVVDLRLADVAAGDVYTLTCVTAAANGGAFGVVSSIRGVLADAEVNKVYIDSKAQFYLDFDAVDFAVNDVFTLKFVEYSAPAKPKIATLQPKIATLTEQITLTCTSAGIANGVGATFSVSGNLSGALGTFVQGDLFTSPVLDLTLARGDVTSQAEQFVEGDVIVIHTTQNPLKALNQQWATVRALPFDSTNTAAKSQFTVPLPDANNDSELILKGPGLAGTDEIFVGIRRSWGASAAFWELAGMRGYAGALTYNEQPSVLAQTNRPSLAMWSGELPYWISVTGRKITLRIRNNTYYMDMYLGLGIPWGSPKFQPYFLVVGGSCGYSAGNWTSLEVNNANYWGARTDSSDGGGDSSLQILNRSGQWQGHLVRLNNSRQDAWYGGGWLNSGHNTLWPFRGNGMQMVRENLDGGTPLFPVTCLPNLGELEGIYAISGFTNIQPEDIIWQPASGKKLVVGTNTYRNSVEDFCAMELV